MGTLKASVDFIKSQLRTIYAGLSLELKDLLLDKLVEALACLEKKEFNVAYKAVCTIYKIAERPEEDVTSLFHSLLFAEDVVTSDSIVFIHQDSPYCGSLKVVARSLGFPVQEHNFNPSFWTKDYLVSIGGDILTPIKRKTDEYLTNVFVNQAKENKALYYGSLELNGHHQSKANFKSSLQWMKRSNNLLDHTVFLNKAMIEGGNFFCAINKAGERFYLIGENTLSETMAYNNISRDQASQLIAEELSCSLKKLLFVPQWTYHLDLQMAYLGKGQFIIHSFDQKDTNFKLSVSERRKVNSTFSFLKNLFEQPVIDATCELLQNNGFEATKVFGCLFYLNDCTDPQQLNYVPYCKSSEDFDGVLALMMNGIALDLGAKGRHFITAKCDLGSFKKSFERSLKRLGIKKVHSVDMLDAYDCFGDFESMLVGIQGAANVTEVAAYMNGALRCQTSIISKSLSPIFNQDTAKHRSNFSLTGLGLSVSASLLPALGLNCALPNKIPAISVACSSKSNEVGDVDEYALSISEIKENIPDFQQTRSSAQSSKSAAKAISTKPFVKQKNQQPITESSYSMHAFFPRPHKSTKLAGHCSFSKKTNGLM